MCLITNTSTPTILDKDLVVYKTFYEENGEIYSPYMDMRYDIGELYYDEEIEVNSFDNKSYTVVEKAYHSCLTRNKARWHININNFKHRIYKCIIPKGSKVFFGTKVSYEEIASDTIIVKRRLWFNKW